jgi:uncharacterized protein
MTRIGLFNLGISCIFGYCCLFIGVPTVKAIVDPLSVPNNRVGIHILDTSEVSEAAKLVNSSGGDWGYVTIPIRSDDRDVAKWTQFFKDSQKYHLIPIIRLATYISKDTWVAPTSYDLVDFANFLNQMPWPTKNRYIVLFNEPNHATEWGGVLAPENYARLLVDAQEIFKSRSSDFFLISAGLDMSAPNTTTSMDAFEFYRQMTTEVPNWYSSINGLSVHAYPNPGFSASPFSATRYGISSFVFEEKYLSRLGISGKPIFITETGTTNSGGFYLPAFNEVWTNENIIAITPFLLFAGAGSFSNFSLLDTNRQPTKNYQDIHNLAKTAGSPLLSPQASQILEPLTTTLSDSPLPGSPVSVLAKLGRLFSLHRPYLNIGETSILVEISDTDATRTQGLSGRKSLPQDSGMLFTFPYKMPLTFWMKDMNFPLDFIWLSEGKVVETTADVPPPARTGGVPLVIQPANFADQVLEANSGFIQNHHIQVGDPVSLIWK